MKLLDSRRGRYLFSLLSGLLLALAWPCIGDLTALIFVAWVPLILVQERLVARSARPRAFYPHVLLAMGVWNICTTWWLWCVSESTGTKLFTLIGPNVGNVLLMSVPLVLARVARRWGGIRLGAVAFVLFWLGFERFHLDWDLSWPWLTLGNVFANNVAWVQWYEWTGHLGGSLWVLLANVVFAWALLRWNTAVVKWKTVLVPSLVVLTPLLGSLWYDLNGANCTTASSMEVVLVQPNIDPYGGKFETDPLVQLDNMLALADQEVTDSTAMVVLPETALQEDFDLENRDGHLVRTGLWENDIGGSRSVQRIVAWLGSHPGAAVLSGMSAGRLYQANEERPVSARRLGNSDLFYDVYNAAVLVTSQGVVGVYNKSKLVPGVEMIPYEEYLGPLSVDLGGTTGSLGRQEERSAMAVGSVQVAPIICYESVYGDYVTGYVRNGADLLVIMTNDGWWDESPGHLQHLAFGRLRAIETRRAIARCANTGISCFIDPCGRLEQPTEWWKPAVIRQRVALNSSLTFFARSGDVIGRSAFWASHGLVILLIVLYIRRRRRA
ncbi:MAG: apolipoprotein N-acyltransferase [Flavobacteriales bacterium]